MTQIVILLIALFALAFSGAGHSGAPARTDMAGCLVRGWGGPITAREVADCAADRAAFRREDEEQQPISTHRPEGKR
ncbi:hypothetical protein [Rhodopseudomonas sp. RCAM05734]|uniref:hypothetical protein n=1 Tax=Rhodopseudomonas sp. RCAM05734 TaxID=3457549 RepID=UPI0040442C71